MTGQAQPAAYALRISEDEVGRYRFMAQIAMAREAALLQRAGIVPGARVVDIGCGPGAFLVELARLVGPQGEVVGVEPDPASRGFAEQAIAAEQLGWARVVDARGDATGLPAADWDAVMVRHVLYHLGAHGAEVVAHAGSLVRPGGHVYLVDTIGSAMTAAPAAAEDLEYLRRYHDFQRSRGNDPDTGLRLHAMLAAAGLELTDHEGSINIVPGAVVAAGGPLRAAQDAMLAAGHITEEQARDFAEVRARVAADPLVRLFTFQIVAVGRRPA